MRALKPRLTKIETALTPKQAALRWVAEAQRQSVTAMAIPRQVLIVPKLPQLASGKIDYPAAMEILCRMTEAPPA